MRLPPPPSLPLSPFVCVYVARRTTTYYDTLGRTRTYPDVLRSTTTYYDVLRRTTTYYNVL
eukprot:11800442-Alexandrium_andersonii.AAC.1